MKTRSEQGLSFFPESPSKVIPLDFEEDDHLDVEGFSECHPMFGAYMSVIEMVFPLSSMLYGLPILKKHHKKIRKLDKTYKVGSPHGPILDSYFNMWEFFDAEIEKSGETLGDIIKLGKT